MMMDCIAIAVFGWLLAGVFLWAFLKVLNQRDDLLVENQALRRMKERYYDKQD